MGSTPVPDRQSKVQQIVRSAFPDVVSEAFSLRVGRPEPSPERKEGAAKLRAELEAMSDAQLDQRYQDYKQRLAKALVDHARREEQERPFNKAKPDFSYWAKAAFWTIEEGVALIHGRDPKLAKPDLLSPYRHVSEFAQEFERVLELAKRSVAAQQLSKSEYPGPFLAWAKRYELPVPDELEAEVAKYGHFIGDWKTLFDQVKNQRDEALKREQETAAQAAKLSVLVGDLRRQVEEAVSAQVQARTVSTPNTAKQTPLKGIDPREAESLRKLCVGMAVAGYKYDPRAARSDTIREIVNDLEVLGIPLDADTVRKHLKIGAELLPPEALPKQ